MGRFKTHPLRETDLFYKSEAVDISSTDDELSSDCRGLYVGGAGDVRVDLQDADDVIFKGVVAGTVLSGFKFSKVYKTNTTATDMLALF